MRATPSASVTIDAPLEVVWGVMLDTERYGEWNSFLQRLECPQPPKEGDPIVLHVRWANGKTARSPERIVTIEPPHTDSDGVTSARLTYVYEGFPAKLRLLGATRHQRLRQAPGGPTTYDTVEEFSGPLVRLAGPGRVAEGFGRHAADLRQRSETLARQG